MAYLNKIYPLKYKEVYIYKPLFQSEAVLIIAPEVAEDLLPKCEKFQILEVDAEFLTLESEDGEIEINVPFGRLIYLNRIDNKLL